MDSAGPTFWYRCDRQDNDPAAFFHYLGQYAPIGDTDLTPQHQLDLPGFVRRTFRRLAGAPCLPRWWVFDDCHEVPDDSSLLDIITEGMRELPADCRFIFTSRRTVPAVWARQVVQGELGVVHPEALAFDRDETMSLVNLASVSATCVDDLLARTDGWAAGLALLAASREVRGHSIDGRADTGYLFDFFGQEVLRAVPQDTQTLLLGVALFPSIDAATAVKFSGVEDAGARLMALAAERFFVQQLDGPPLRYRLHDLFRAFLLDQRKRTLSADRERDDTRRAAALMTSAGDREGAIDLLIAVGAWKELVSLICDLAPGFVRAGRLQTLAGWIDCLPDGLRVAAGWPSYWRAQCCQYADPVAARAHYEVATTSFRARGDVVGEYLAWCGRVESWINQWNEVGPLRDLVAELEALLVRAPLPTPEVGGRVAIGMFAALMYGQPDHPALDAWVGQVRNMVLGVPDPKLQVEVGSHLLIYYAWWRGDLAAAGHLVGVLDPLASRVDMPPMQQILWAAMSASFLWMSARTDEALAAVDRGLARSAEQGIPVMDFLLHAQGVFAALSAGRREVARQHLARLSATLGSRRRLDALLYHYLAAWEALDRDDVDGAASHAQAARADVEASGSPFHTANALVCLGLLDRRRGSVATAIDAMEQALSLARGANNRAVEYQALLHLADFHQGRGDSARGLERLREALALARGQGFRNHAFWRDVDMARLYAWALEEGIETAYVIEMIRLRGLVSPGEGGHPEWPTRYRLEVMGGFQLAREGTPIAFAGSLGGKPLELLKALVAFGARQVPIARIVDALWPDAEGDQGRRSFDTTLHRLRRIFEGDTVLSLHNGLLSLDFRQCGIDILALEGVLDRLAAATSLAQALPLADHVLRLYRGDFLAGDDHGWIIARRDRLAMHFGRAMRVVISSLEQAGRADQAAALRERLDGLSAR